MAERKDIVALLQAALDVLATIARGRADNGRAMSAETARQMARQTLTELGLNWEGRQ